MALNSFKFYTDSGLTAPLTGSLQAILSLGGAPVDTVLYLGSTASGLKLEANSSPGVDPITISVTDSNTGGGEPATAIKLATTSGGLAAAVPGAALNLPATINSGVANAKAIYIRVTDATALTGNYTDLGLTTNTLKESAA